MSARPRLHRRRFYSGRAAAAGRRAASRSPGAGRAHPLHHARSPECSARGYYPRRDAARRQPLSPGTRYSLGVISTTRADDGRLSPSAPRPDRGLRRAPRRQDAAERPYGERQASARTYRVCPRAAGRASLRMRAMPIPAAIPTPAVREGPPAGGRRPATLAAPARPGPGEPDLAGALVDRDPHHRQDADGADHQRNAADGRRPRRSRR